MRNALLLVLALSGASLCMGADVYPSKPVRVIVSFAAGGSTDLVARVTSQQLSEQLGKAFTVENGTGGSGTIANGFVARSAPDGYTLLLADTAWTILPGLQKSLPYEVPKDFTPIMEVARSPNVLVVQPSLNANTLKEFILLAQANPGKFNYGSNGSGGVVHLASELFKTAAKVSIVHVPYKGGSDLITAMLAGQIQMAFTGIPTVLARVKSGQFRALAVTTDGKRTPSLPDVPSMSEAGVPGMEVYSWFGLVGPAGLPKEIVSKLYTEMLKAIALPSVREALINQGAEPVGSSPEEFTAHIRSELQRWAGIIKSAGIAAD